MVSGAFSDNLDLNPIPVARPACDVGNRKTLGPVRLWTGSGHREKVCRMAVGDVSILNTYISRNSESIGGFNLQERHYPSRDSSRGDHRHQFMKVYLWEVTGRSAGD